MPTLPSPGARAKGRLVYSAMAQEVRIISRTMAVSITCLSNPAFPSMLGTVASTYAMVTKVVIPATSSLCTVVWLAPSGIHREGCSRPWIDLRLFADNPFILHFPDQNTGRTAAQLFEQCHIQPPISFRSRSSLLCIQLAIQGLGVCFAPATYVQYAASTWDLCAFSVGETPLVNQLVLAYRKNYCLTEYARDFIDITRRVLQ